MARVLIIEHQDSYLDEIRRFFAPTTHDLYIVNDGESGVIAAQRHRPHLMLVPRQRFPWR